MIDDESFDHVKQLINIQVKESMWCGEPASFLEVFRKINSIEI
jgi:hypothetical protein